MPAARGVKRTASKSSAATTSTAAPKNKKKRGVTQLEIPTAPKKRGRVFTCGQGDVGQLGLGEDVIETNKFKQVTALGDKVVDCCAGGMHTIALDCDGKVWTFGCNDEGALGRPTAADSEEGAPRAVALPGRAVAVSAGDSHSAALLHDGRVYAWGAFRDSHGSMGLVVRGREGKACREPAPIDVGEPAHAIASGGDHLVILCTSGSVYTMGCGEQGQLGRLSQRSASRDARQGFSALLTPGKVTLKGGACRVWAGYHATFALHAHTRRVYAWGLNNYGQLGITGEKRKTALFSPVECTAFTPTNNWTRVACGQHHTLALDDSGQVYAIGRCEYGRLGLGGNADAEALEAVPRLRGRRCVSIAAGTCNSFAVTDTGEVLAWGMGSEGQLGTGASCDAEEPAPAPAPPARHVAAGGQHAVLLTDDPVSQKEESPAPEPETAEQKTDEAREDEEEPQVPEKKKPRGTKRQKKQEQEDEVSSTSSAAQPHAPNDAKPQKVNGDEKKETPMEVDETDNATEKKEEPTTEEQKETETEPEAEKTEPETEPKEESKPETTDTSSQETTDSDTKSQETTKSEDKSNDVEMAEEKSEVNGEPELVEPKQVEGLLPNPTPLTTTA
ncbi:unnamed protein product [Diatraea saccharalis]|uniref:RCC1-like domain-containing protein n=1 Tax=Diatraea saccharalis TaxID=40085 RepID=A0A9P0G379_9NEOP|nr:unnamed protein product [Diatraea saccharalis]